MVEVLRMRIEMPRAFIASVVTVLFIVSAFMAMGVPAGATQRDTSRADLNVTDETVISSSQAADNVNIAANATLKVVTGGTLVCKAINNNGGTIQMDGGTILMDRTVDGNSADAVIKGSGYNFIMKNGAKIIMRGAPAANNIDNSQGGNAQVTGTYTGVIRIEDSTIEGYGGHSVNITNPWLTQIALSAWESAGGSAEVSLAMAKDPNGWTPSTSRTAGSTWSVATPAMRPTERTGHWVRRAREAVTAMVAR
jgi:hypothetical protein